MFGGDRDDGDIGRLGQVGDRGIGLQPLHFGAVGVHRVDRALEALCLHVGDRPSADPRRIVGSAQDCDGSRREQWREAGESGVRHDLGHSQVMTMRGVHAPRSGQFDAGDWLRQGSATGSPPSGRENQMRPTFSVWLILLAMAGLIAPSSAITAASAQTITLKLSHFLGPSELLRGRFRAAVGQRAGSEDQRQGEGRDLQRQLADRGSDEAGNPGQGWHDRHRTRAARRGGRPISASSVIELPFVVHDAQSGSRALWKLYKDGVFGAEYQDYKVLALFVHNPGLIHTATRPITSPADLKGVRLRAPNRTVAVALESIGRTRHPAGERRYAGRARTAGSTASSPTGAIHCPDLTMP